MVMDLKNVEFGRYLGSVFPKVQHLGGVYFSESN
jgi:hypothetical protein